MSSPRAPFFPLPAPLAGPSLAFLLTVLTTGCASTALRPDPAADPEIQELKARVVELQRKAAVSEVEIARLRQQVADLEARQGGGRISARPSPGAPVRPASSASSPGSSAASVPRGSSSGAMAPEAAPVRREVLPVVEEADLDVEDVEDAGVAEDAPPRPAPRATAPPSSASGTTARPGTAAPAPSPSRTPSRTTPPAPRTTAPPPATPSTRTTPPPAPARPSSPRVLPEDDEPEPVDPPAPATSSGSSAQPPSGAPGTAGTELTSPAAQALYDRGYTLYHQGRYVDAEASFQRFLQGQPAGELADNAQYWIGECRYSRGDMRGALAAFRETVERYPQGNKVSDAMLKAGQSLEMLGDVEGARTTYREVARRFPGTAAAAAADERRSRLP